jgi:hypothetical protein
VPFAVLLVPFFVFVAAFVLIGLSQTHTSQHGSAGIPNWLDISLSGVSLRDAIGLAKKASRSLVSKFASSHLKMLTAFLHGMAHLWKQEFAAMRAEAQATAKVAGAIEHAIPREAHKAAAPAMARAKVANRHAEHALSQGHMTARELHRFRARTHAQLRHDAHAIDVTIPRDIGHVRRREEELSRDQTKLRERTTSLENGAVRTFEWIRSHPLSSVTAVFAGAVAVALARLGYGFLRCRNWRNLGRRLDCGMGAWILKSLELVTGFVLGYLAVLKPEVLAEEAVDAVDGIEFVLTKILDN